MPRTPSPDEEDLDTIPHPVFYAEQALLGALLLDPQRLGDVPGIGPDAFSTAAHAALFAAVRSLPTPDPAQHAQNTKWLEEVLTAALEQARGLTASYLHSVDPITVLWEGQQRGLLTAGFEPRSEPTKIRATRGPATRGLAESWPFRWSAAARGVYHQHSKNLLVSYSPKRLGFF